MDAETLEALKGSIAKWEAIVAGTGEDKGDENCPLCLKFHICHRSEPGRGCDGCPVAGAGHRSCEDTPYEKYADAMNRASPDHEVANQAALAEIDFLKSLLPAEST